MHPEFILEWFDYADTDLSSAEHLLTMHPQPYEIICYLCEQSAEKNLKGFLVYKGVEEPPKTHQLEYLCKQCAEYDSSFNELIEHCSVLTDYSVQPRYPHEMLIEKHHMENALLYARQIKDFDPIASARNDLKQFAENEADIALYDEAVENSDGYSISSENLKEKYGI